MHDKGVIKYVQCHPTTYKKLRYELFPWSNSLFFQLTSNQIMNIVWM